MRLIDAEKLEKDIRDYADKKIMNPGYIEYANGICSTIGVINNQPTVNQWIPVSERLPDKYHIQASIRYSDGTELVKTVFVKPTDNGFRYEAFPSCEDVTDLVIAWQPLPEPYISKK